MLHMHVLLLCVNVWFIYMLRTVNFISQLKNLILYSLVCVHLSIVNHFENKVNIYRFYFNRDTSEIKRSELSETRDVGNTKCLPLWLRVSLGPPPDSSPSINVRFTTNLGVRENKVARIEGKDRRKREEYITSWPSSFRVEDTESSRIEKFCLYLGQTKLSFRFGLSVDLQLISRTP